MWRRRRRRSSSGDVEIEIAAKRMERESGRIERQRGDAERAEVPGDVAGAKSGCVVWTLRVAWMVGVSLQPVFLERAATGERAGGSTSDGGLQLVRTQTLRRSKQECLCSLAGQVVEDFAGLVELGELFFFGAEFWGVGD